MIVCEAVAVDDEAGVWAREKFDEATDHLAIHERGGLNEFRRAGKNEETRPVVGLIRRDEFVHQWCHGGDRQVAHSARPPAHARDRARQLAKIGVVSAKTRFPACLYVAKSKVETTWTKGTVMRSRKAVHAVEAKGSSRPLQRK